jgi:glutamine phosphoribosylpyrophosphate amidotransferase
MNIGYLIDLIKADASLLDNVEEFIKKMNEPTIVVVTTTREIVAESEVTVSLAQRNGGELTQSDIDYALKLIAQEPLTKHVEDKFQAVLEAVKDGTAATADAIDQKIKDVSGK